MKMLKETIYKIGEQVKLPLKLLKFLMMMKTILFLNVENKK